MPIISNFPIGGCGSSGIALGAVTNITTVVSHGKAYLKWTDPTHIIKGSGNVFIAIFGDMLFFPAIALLYVFVLFNYIESVAALGKQRLE